MTALWTDPETGIEHDLDRVGGTVRLDDQYKQETHDIRCRVCPHDGPTDMVWATIANGKTQLRNQCGICGALIGTALKQDLAAPDTPKVDTDKAERWDQDYYDKLRDAARRLIERRKQWWRDYNAYLEADDWRRKRELVFKRAGGMCEGCRAQPAQQVHHLTYTDVGNEFLWQLVAVCAPCHERFHSSRETADQAHKAA